MKAFSKFPNIAFADVEDAWTGLAQAGVSCPPKIHAKIVLKKVEALLAESKLMDMAKLLAIPLPADADVDEEVRLFGVHAIDDQRVRDETCCEAAARLSQAIFPYRLPKETSIPETQTRTKELIDDIKHLKLVLPGDVQLQLNTAVTILNFDKVASKDELNNAIEIVTAAQSPKRAKNTFISAFAISRLGRSMLKDAATFHKQKCQKQVSLTQLKQAATTCNELASGKISSASFPGDFSTTVAVFRDAMDKVGMELLDEEDMTFIKETCEKLEKVLAAALEARCGVLAEATTQDC